MVKIVKEFPNDIIFKQKGPSISLYQTTHRHFPENEKDLIVFKNNIKEIESKLKEKYKDINVEKILKPFNELKEDKEFWNMSLDGICILANEEDFIVYKIAQQIEDHLLVSDVFHITPLIKIFKTDVEYNLLAFDGENFKLYQGNKNGLQEIVLDNDVPKTIEEVLGFEYTDKFLNHDTGSHDGNISFHGQGSKKEEVQIDLEKYFRYIDKFIFDNYSKVTKLPLVLVSLTENQGLFRKISSNRYLMEEGIEISFDSIDLKKAATMAWDIVNGVNEKRINNLLEKYNQSKANNLGSDDLHKIKKAIFDNRIETMVIEEHRDISDELDSLVIKVLMEKGQIVVLPKEKMPSDTGVAAIYRY